MSDLIVARQFRGPPFTANGGYICGLMVARVGGRGQAMLRAGVPLDVAIAVQATGDDGVALAGPDGAVLGSATATLTRDLPEPPAPLTQDQARLAQSTSPYGQTPLHRGCFSCCILRDPGEGLGVFVGQVEGREPGHAAGLWTPHANFACADGTMPDEIIWGAMDCSGSMAWGLKTGHRVGLLGTMSGEVLRAPRADEPCVIQAWPLEVEGRKYFAGVALWSATGELLARSGQIWIGRPPVTA